MPETLATTRIDIRSRDAVPLAVWVSGDGPPIVLVHGSIADHTTLDPFVAVLAERMTAYAMDRRGFGGSGDAPEYSIEREFDDVATVVDAVAARQVGPVTLFGHSYGAKSRSAVRRDRPRSVTSCWKSRASGWRTHRA